LKMMVAKQKRWRHSLIITYKYKTTMFLFVFCPLLVWCYHIAHTGLSDGLFTLFPLSIYIAIFVYLYIKYWS
jgi:hypothetical protein